MMWGAGGGSVGGINERGGGSAGPQGGGGGGMATYLYLESMAYATGPIYEAPNRQVYRKYLV
jgi:hypothetical protein